MCNRCENGSYDALDKAYADMASFDFVVEKALGLSEVASIAKAELRLRKYVEGKWNVRKSEAAKTAARMAKGGKGYKEISSAVGKIMNRWSKDVLPVYNVEMRRVYRLARIAGHKKATGQTKASLQFNIPKTEESTVTKAKPKVRAVPNFDLVDQQAMEMLEDKNIFWVGNHYDANISDSVRDTARNTLVEAGQSTTTAGKLMESRITGMLSAFVTPSGYTGSQKQYFEGLVANAMTVGRVYGQLRSFSQIGITKYTIVNPGGDRICPVCASIQGTTFETKQGLEQIEREYAASNPEDIKSIHPWPKESQVIGKDADGLSAMGLSLPPYHFRCRCTCDVSTEIESYEELVPIPFPSSSKAA
jgi:hypothetical protein